MRLSKKQFEINKKYNIYRAHTRLHRICRFQYIVFLYRNLRGLSQEALAEKIEVSVSHISKIEAPQANTSLSLDMLYLIAEGLDMDIAAFFSPIEISNPYMKSK